MKICNKCHIEYSDKIKICEKCAGEIFDKGRVSVKNKVSDNQTKRVINTLVAIVFYILVPLVFNGIISSVLSSQSHDNSGAGILVMLVEVFIFLPVALITVPTYLLMEKEEPSILYGPIALLVLFLIFCLF
jgi:hypothetical protein